MSAPHTPDEELPLADHPLTAARLDKLRRLRDQGLDPYPVRYQRSHLAADLHVAYPDLGPGSETGERVSVAGRVMLHRSFGKLVFVTLQDASGRIQLMADSRRLPAPDFELVSELDAGDWVGAGGEVVTTRKGELSVAVEEVQLLAKALRPLPEKWRGLSDVEARSRQRYLDLMVNEESRRVALTRSAVVAELRRQFTERGYVEVETPVLQTQAGGALARPFVTHHNALDIDMYLRIATELHLKRLVVGGLEKVFEIGRVFRNEGIDATHNPEFTMLESYEALADYLDILRLVEEVIPAVTEAATGGTVIEYRGRPLDLSPPYRRARHLDLVREAVGEELGFDTPLDQLREICRRHGIEPHPAWGHGKLLDELFEELVADRLWEPVFVMDHPKEISPLARAHRQHPHLTERFELFIAGAEYANAFSELNDPLDQRARFEAQAQARAAGDAEAHPVDEDYLLALEYGLPPTGGLGIGVDRLVMLLTDRPHIREVILFPTLRPRGGGPSA